MRIISGKYRGRRISGPSGDGVRPATDRVRESVFNILQNRLDLSGISVLDLFAGTGSLGFEALSRGAAEVTFVDNGRAATALIRKNAEVLGCPEVCDVVTQDAVGFLSGIKAIFRLIFADPPYEYPALPEIPARVFSAGILEPGGYLIIEHRRGTRFEPAFPPEAVFTRRFGNTEVTFFANPPGSKEDPPDRTDADGGDADQQEEQRG
jgi:16S rRNA (guanine966-N2)-methyltransferase